MKLPKNTLKLWRRRKFLQADSYLDLDPTPTGEEESAAFEDPAKLVARLNQKNLSQNIDLRKRYALFSLRCVGAWLLFVAGITYLQGTGGNFYISIHGFRIMQFTPFHLEQWAFVGVCVTSTVSILGLVDLITRALFSVDANEQGRD